MRGQSATGGEAMERFSCTGSGTCVFMPTVGPRLRAGRRGSSWDVGRRSRHPVECQAQARILNAFPRTNPTAGGDKSTPSYFHQRFYVSTPLADPARVRDEGSHPGREVGSVDGAAGIGFGGTNRRATVMRGCATSRSKRRGFAEDSRRVGEYSGEHPRHGSRLRGGRGASNGRGRHDVLECGHEAGGVGFGTGTWFETASESPWGVSCRLIPADVSDHQDPPVIHHKVDPC
jgi:hypothetical protein